MTLSVMLKKAVDLYKGIEDYFQIPKNNLLRRQYRKIHTYLTYPGVYYPTPPKNKLSESEFRQAVDLFQIQMGDVVFLTHSLDNLNINFNPLKIIEIFKGKITDQGLLVMLALPFSGYSEDYLQSHPTFDVYTPSQTGLLTDVFNRMEGVYRSLNPLSSVCVWGKDAKKIVDRDHDFTYPFNQTSVFAYMNEKNAKAVGLGVELPRLSAVHYFEYLQKDTYPIFGEKKYPVNIVDQGKRRVEEIYPINRRLSRYVGKLKKELITNKEGVYRIINGRFYYSYRFQDMKDASFKLMEKNQYFKPLKNSKTGL